MHFFHRILLYVAFLAQISVLAHGDLHWQITALTGNIEKNPANHELYLQRAELRRLHGEADLALNDCDAAEKLKPDLASVHFIRGKIFFTAGKPELAKKALDTFLAAQPNHAEALVTRARVLEKLGRHLPAARDFTTAIERSNVPEPDYFLERAQALIAAGQIQTALSGLDDGVKKLGSIAPLQLLAIDLELREKNFDAALRRVDEISAQSARKESWLALRGEILERAGRTKEARETFTRALEAIASLPANRRQTPFVQELQVKVEEALERLAGDSANNNKL